MIVVSRSRSPARFRLERLPHEPGGYGSCRSSDPSPPGNTPVFGVPGLLWACCHIASGEIIVPRRRAVFVVGPFCIDCAWTLPYQHDLPDPYRCGQVSRRTRGTGRGGHRRRRRAGQRLGIAAVVVEGHPHLEGLAQVGVDQGVGRVGRVGDVRRVRHAVRVHPHPLVAVADIGQAVRVRDAREVNGQRLPDRRRAGNRGRARRRGAGQRAECRRRLGPLAVSNRIGGMDPYVVRRRRLQDS